MRGWHDPWCPECYPHPPHNTFRAGLRRFFRKIRTYIGRNHP